jgi:hypothetical protein
MAEIVQLFLQFSAQVKLYHWQTYSYPRHKASDMLHTGMQPLIDQFVEIYQGKKQRVFLEEKSVLPIYNLDDSNMLDFLLHFKKFLMEDLERVIGDGRNTDLLNIRDEMLGLVNQTLYLFTLE